MSSRTLTLCVVVVLAGCSLLLEPGVVGSRGDVGEAGESDAGGGGGEEVGTRDVGGGEGRSDVGDAGADGGELVAEDGGAGPELSVAACVADLDCDDENPCTDDGCASGVCERLPNVAPCDDGEACTHSDTCGGGRCSGTAYTCTSTECASLSCDGVGTCAEVAQVDGTECGGRGRFVSDEPGYVCNARFACGRCQSGTCATAPDVSPTCELKCGGVGAACGIRRGVLCERDECTAHVHTADTGNGITCCVGTCSD